MTAYDDMPVGTVLRNPDDGMTYVKTSATVHRRPYWIAITGDGSTEGNFAIEMPPFLVEMVEKPAKKLSGTRLIDRDGDAWEERGSGWHMISCVERCETHNRTRADVEADFGPLTEATS